MSNKTFACLKPPLICQVYHFATTNLSATVVLWKNEVFITQRFAGYDQGKLEEAQFILNIFKANWKANWLRFKIQNLYESTRVDEFKTFKPSRLDTFFSDLDTFQSENRDSFVIRVQARIEGKNTINTRNLSPKDQMIECSVRHI
jgi:hypothetical protein